MPDKAAYSAKVASALEEGRSLKDANLEKVALKNLRLERADLSGSNLSQADLSCGHLFDVNFTGAHLLGADLSKTDLTHCDFKDADLTKANLTEARLWNASLEGAILAEATLRDADLWNARFYNVKIWHTDFSGAKSLERRSFSREPHLLWDSKIREDGLLSAREAYRDLKQYFLANGMYDDAGWASFKEKSVERFIMKENRDPHYLPSLAMGILCGYGEKPSRIILSALFTILGYAFLYLLLNAVEYTGIKNSALRWPDYIYYSTITFTTVGYGDIVPKQSSLFRLLAASEAFIGVYLTGLFIFTLARRYSAR
jgi:uncharacterized protein YjbI with pentapeptide repeats